MTKISDKLYTIQCWVCKNWNGRYYSSHKCETKWRQHFKICKKIFSVANSPFYLVINTSEYEHFRSSQTTSVSCGSSLTAACWSDVCAREPRGFPAAWPCTDNTDIHGPVSCRRIRRSRGDATLTSSDTFCHSGDKRRSRVKNRRRRHSCHPCRRVAWGRTCPRKTIDELWIREMALSWMLESNRC